MTRWWLALPEAARPKWTDICSNCGHVRWRHSQGFLNEVKCNVRQCDCGGRIAYPFHIAGLPKNFPRDSVTVNGQQRPINQPRQPGTPIDG